MDGCGRHKKCPKQPPLPWFPSLVLSTSAYSVLVLRPPTSRLAAWDNIKATTSFDSLSSFHPWPLSLPCTIITIVK
jgi:hypothetical protein